MTWMIHNKLQKQRNFQSIWHSSPQLLARYIKEDEITRRYIQGTMKSYRWKISEIIIKRKVHSFHIAFQTQYKKKIQRRRPTKNRLKNQIKYNMWLKRNQRNQNKNFFRRSLYHSIIILTRGLKQQYPKNNITFYIQRVNVLQLNVEFIKQWILFNIKKKKSHKRLISRVIFFFKISAKLKIKIKSDRVNTIWTQLESPIKKDLVAWLSSNLIYLYLANNTKGQNNKKISR
jgi:hypothetical protein